VPSAAKRLPSPTRASAGLEPGWHTALRVPQGARAPRADRPGVAAVAPGDDSQRREHAPSHAAQCRAIS
jgi:hypothetical protein